MAADKNHRPDDPLGPWSSAHSVPCAECRRLSDRRLNLPVLHAGSVYDGWVGFVNGKPDVFRDDGYYDGVPHANIFPTKQAAMRCYYDVRRVNIVLQDIE